jgi:hypothetical protein
MYFVLMLGMYIYHIEEGWAWYVFCMGGRKHDILNFKLERRYRDDTFPYVSSPYDTLPLRYDTLIPDVFTST